ncbi:hypothetical protein KO465_10645 [Candidatus Micrarchaeota archaeon]|jgi:hypothetical protein|nr:hypothetical protein [Candidatus Micrarchaeota archaeon]
MKAIMIILIFGLLFLNGCILANKNTDIEYCRTLPQSTQTDKENRDNCFLRTSINLAETDRELNLITDSCSRIDDMTKQDNCFYQTSLYKLLLEKEADAALLCSKISLKRENIRNDCYYNLAISTKKQIYCDFIEKPVGFEKITRIFYGGESLEYDYKSMCYEHFN